MAYIAPPQSEGNDIYAISKQQLDLVPIARNVGISVYSGKKEITDDAWQWQGSAEIAFEVRDSSEANQITLWLRSLLHGVNMTTFDLGLKTINTNLPAGIIDSRIGNDGKLWFYLPRPYRLTGDFYIGDYVTASLGTGAGMGLWQIVSLEDATVAALFKLIPPVLPGTLRTVFAPARGNTLQFRITSPVPDPKGADWAGPWPITFESNPMSVV